MTLEFIVYTTIIVALAFDFINGFHDAANSVATIVSTRVLRPSWAVFWAAFFNFIAFLFFDLKVATTLGKGIIDPAAVDVWLVFSALTGAIVWNIITWYFGLPSSSSHALIGGLAGAGAMKAGLGVINVGGMTKILLSIIGSPLLGLFLGSFLMRFIILLVRSQSPRKIDRVFRKMQYFSAAMYSLGHGGNDAQKTMGIITVVLLSSGMISSEGFQVPLWVVLSCQFAMGLGTIFGGWRIVKTMGMKLTHLKPVGGFCAETSGALTLFLATSLGIPVSTTHTITGSIVGVGSVLSSKGVRWSVAGNIIWAWVLTIPLSALMAAIAFKLTTYISLVP